MSQLNVGLQKPSTSFSRTVAPMAEYNKALLPLMLIAISKLGIDPFFNGTSYKLHQVLLFDSGENAQPYTHEFDNQLEPGNDNKLNIFYCFNIVNENLFL